MIFKKNCACQQLKPLFPEIPSWSLPRHADVFRAGLLVLKSHQPVFPTFDTSHVVGLGGFVENKSDCWFLILGLIDVFFLFEPKR
jgi:hypothetical protein